MNTWIIVLGVVLFVVLYAVMAVKAAGGVGGLRRPGKGSVETVTCASAATGFLMYRKHTPGP